jgi:hypothetical protein
MLSWTNIFPNFEILNNFWKYIKPIYAVRSQIMVAFGECGQCLEGRIGGFSGTGNFSVPGLRYSLKW